MTDLQPFGVYSFVATGKPHPHEDILRAALARAFAKGRDGAWKGVPQGIDALQQYGSDVRDPAKDFGECPEWFCWAAFERLMARRCAEVWLRSVADTLARRGRGDGAGDASRWASKAADHYGEAFRLYDRYRAEVVESVSPGRPLHERARTPERIRIIAPLLERGIAEEAAGLEALERVVEEGRTES